MTAATISSGRGTRTAYVSQTTFNSIVSTPAFANLRPTRFSMRPNIEKGTSQEYTTDRNVRNDFMTAKGASGRLEGELHYGTWDSLFAHSFMNSWSSNVLILGSTPSFFTLEDTYELGVLDQYQRFVGCMIDGMDLNFQPNDTVKVGFDIIAREMTAGTTAITGATYSPAPTLRMPATTESITGVTFGGISATFIVRSLSLRIANNLRKRPVFDDPRSVQFGLGMADVTGELEVYFDDYTVYQEVYTQSSATMTFVVGLSTPSRYKIELPTMKWGDGELMPRERDNDIIVRMPFRAVYGGSTDGSIKITRAW